MGLLRTGSLLKVLAFGRLELWTRGGMRVLRAVWSILGETLARREAATTYSMCPEEVGRSCSECIRDLI